MTARERLLKATDDGQRSIIAAELRKLIAERTPAELERVHRETYK